LLSIKIVVLPGFALIRKPVLGLPPIHAAACDVTSTVTHPGELIATPGCTGVPATGPPTPETVPSDQAALAVDMSIAPAVVTEPT
jgi:hypothetical protein